MRFLAGDQCADLLGIPDSNFMGVMDVSASLLNELDVPDHDALLASLFGRLAKEGMRGIIAAERDGKQASFRLPESLLRSVIPNT
jgi:hypothetical protein